MPLGHLAADEALKGGLVRGALHEVFPARVACTAAATGFAVALALRTSSFLPPPSGRGLGGGKAKDSDACGKAPSLTLPQRGRGKKELEGRPLLWVRQDYSAREYGEPFAPGLVALGLDPDRLILVRVASATDALRVAADALVCAGLGAVIAEIPGAPKILDLTATRRLSLLAARSKVTALLLRLEATPQPSAAETRWLVGSAPSHEEDDEALRFSAQLARNRHGELGRWDMEWSSCDGCFREPGERPDEQAAARAVAAAPFDGPHSAPRKRRTA